MCVCEGSTGSSLLYDFDTYNDQLIDMPACIVDQVIEYFSSFRVILVIEDLHFYSID